MARATPRLPRLRGLLSVCCVFALVVTCVFNFVSSPQILCLLDGKCKGAGFMSVIGVYPRTIAFACLVSFVATLCRNGRLMAVHDRNVEAHDAYEPTTREERRRRAAFWGWSAATCVSVIMPVNLLRLWFMLANDTERVVMVFFVFMYAQNLSMCFAELRFVCLCRGLSARFAKVNRDLERLGEEIVDPATASLEAAAAQAEAAAVGTSTAADDRSSTAVGPFPAAAVDPDARDDRHCSRHHRRRRLRRVMYREDFYGPPSGEHSVANALEVFRIRYQLLRDAVHSLVDLFGLPIGMSLFTLCVMTLFDIYYQVFRDMGASSRLLVFLYFWLFQYFIRFYTIVMSAHNITKQALKSKTLLTNINNRYLDYNTKVELQLFLDQIASSSVEFTACDFFTLNTHLITSTFAAGTTYLVILLQFNPSKI